MPDTNIFTPIVDMMIRSGLWILPALLGLAAFKALLPRLKGAIGEAMVGGRLDQLFGEVLHDIIIPDGRGGLTQIDHVALTVEGLLVVETKNYSGTIFGTVRDAKWTQKLSGRSYRFQNPLRQNQLHVAALQALELGIPVQGRVVFSGNARFPKGMPAGVFSLSHLQQGPVGASVPKIYLTAWEKLRQIAWTDGAARREHLALIRKRHGGVPTWIAWAALALSAVWLAVWWVWPRQPFGMVPRPVARQKRQVPDAAKPAVPSPAPVRRTVVPVAKKERPVPVAEINWSDQEGSRRSECNLAIAALLIEDSARNRRERDLACGGSSSDRS
jgi:hypothetical protein